MEVAVLAEQIRNMDQRCGERMCQLEKNITLMLEAQNELLTQRMDTMEKSLELAHQRITEQKKVIDPILAWKNKQIGAAMAVSAVFGLIAGWVASAISSFVSRLKWS